MLKREGSFERTSKRSPYQDAPGFTDDGGDDNGGNSILYVLLTLILLVVLYPVGLIMLWVRKFNMRWAGKLLISVVTAVVFCFVLAFAANIPTNNEQVKNIQMKLNDGFDWFYTKTDSAASDIAEMLKPAQEKLANLWDRLDEDVARKGLELYEYVRPNVLAVKQDAAILLVEKFGELRGYEKPAAAPVPVKQNGNKGVIVSVSATATTSALPTSTLAPVATPTPTPTPKPTETPAPITLPKIKNVALAPVYYTKNGTYYHLTKTCSGMSPALADSHTLQEAMNANKKVCENCGVVSTDMLDYDGNYFWVDGKNIAHTTDECAEFPEGKYTVIPFEDVYQGHYTYCPNCKADVCYEYMRQNDSRFNTAYEELDDATKLLYDYEKSITVYYGENSRKYHADTDCNMMYDAKYVHTLYEALHTDGKDRCALCMPFTETEAEMELARLTNAAE